MNKEKFLKQLLNRKEDLIKNFAFQKLVLNDLIEIGFIYINEHYSKENNKFANMMLQMSLLKAKSILKLSEGEKFTGVKNEKAPIVDIQSISSVYRSLFENFCYFNHLYIKKWSNEEFLILENMWRISSLKQRINLLEKSPLLKEIEYSEKIEKEKKEVLKREREIENTSLFKLDEKNIKKLIKTNKWQLTIKNNKVRYVSWTEMFNESLKNHANSNKVYQRFSLDAHPSYFSVFQFGDLYKNRHDLERRTTVIFETIQLLCCYLNDFEKLLNKIPNTNIESKYLIEILGKNTN